MPKIYSIDLHGTTGTGNGNGAGASGIWKKIRCGTCGITGNPYSLNGTCGTSPKVTIAGPKLWAWLHKTIAASTTNSFCFYQYNKST